MVVLRRAARVDRFADGRAAVENGVADDDADDDADEQLDGVRHGDEHGQVAENQVGAKQRDDDQLSSGNRQVQHQPFPADNFAPQPDEDLDAEAENEDAQTGGREFSGGIQFPGLEEEDDAGLPRLLRAAAGRLEPAHQHVHPALAKFVIGLRRGSCRVRTRGRRGGLAVPRAGVVMRLATVDGVARLVFGVEALGVFMATAGGQRQAGHPAVGCCAVVAIFLVGLKKM